MLIYARIILALIILTSVLNIVGGVVMMMASPVMGVMGLMMGALFAWLAYTNYKDASNCVEESYKRDVAAAAKSLL